MEKYMRDACQ